MSVVNPPPERRAYARRVNPQDIALPKGYTIEVYAEGLNVPINILFTDLGELLVADAGVTDGNGKVLRRTTSGFEVIADGFRPPLTGINWRDGNIYVSHRGAVTMLEAGGSRRDLISGLPSFGDHHNNRVVFGHDGLLYFGQGTATNSGVVGLDNDWIHQHPYFHDFPGSDVQLLGRNFETENPLCSAPSSLTMTGAYRPFRMPNKPGETAVGAAFASGSILRMRPDGSKLELIAWGLRNPFRIKFDRYGRLFAANHGMDVRGSRPIHNSPDEFQWIRPGFWYGWPDYTGGYPVTLPYFKPDGREQPGFLLARHPMDPPAPVANFTPHSATMGFDFNENPTFGPVGDVFIAEFGSEAPVTTGGLPAPAVGHRVSRISMPMGQIVPFAVNRTGVAASETGSGGFERPIDAVFGLDGALYICDFCMSRRESPAAFIPNTGVIWKIKRA